MYLHSLLGWDIIRATELFWPNKAGDQKPYPFFLSKILQILAPAGILLM